MPEEMSELYIYVLLKARTTGKILKPKIVNHSLNEYNAQLKNLRVEEARRDGKTFKFWVTEIDEKRHEALDEKTLICSRKVKLEIRNPLPHSADNYNHRIGVRIHHHLMQLRVEHFQAEKEKIVVETISTHIGEGERTGRWPHDQRDQRDQAFV